MQKVQENHIFSGVQRDLSISKHPIQFLYDARNIRLTAREGDTLLSITNEQGTADTSLTVTGTYLGHCLLNQYLVVFTRDAANNKDYIYRIDLENISSTILYGSSDNHTSLGFHTSYPIEAIASYETKTIQKVYWTDGKNQPRIINIAPDNDSNISNYNKGSFDFVQELQLNETVTVSRLLGSSGEFPPGVIQYALTYYNKYGQESNIFYTSPLRFIAPIDRGGSPEEKVSCSFEIKVKDVDTNFDFLRIYSIMRSSLNATPLCKRVTDIEIAGLTNNTITYTDTGYSGDTVDPTELLYKGGEEITAGTIEQKDGTLFLGDLGITRPQLMKELADGGYYSASTHKITADVAMDSNRNTIEAVNFSGSNYGYNYFSQLSCKNDSGEVGVPCAGFKRGDTYRCGVQFQYKNGVWSHPFYIKDLTVPETSIILQSLTTTSALVLFPRFEGVLSHGLTTFLQGLGYKKARAVIVYPEPQDRKTICQGVVCPTVYTNNHRDTDKDLLAQSSWFFRPKKGINNYTNNNETVSPWSETGDSTIPYTKSNNRYNPSSDEGEDHPYGYAVNIRQVEVDGWFDYNDRFRIDWDLLTLHSPDIEFDEQLYNTDFSNTQCTHVGRADFQITLSDIDIQTESPTVSNSGGGFIHKSYSHQNSWGICSGLFYDDYAVDDDGDLKKWSNQKSAYKWMVYPWQRTGSLNNDINRPSDKGTPTAILKKKVISNLRVSYPNMFNQAVNIVTADFTTKPELFSSDEVSVIKIGSSSSTANVYHGNVDTILNSELQGRFFAFDGENCTDSYVETAFNSMNWWKLYGKYRVDQSLHEYGIYKFHTNGGSDPWDEPVNWDIGETYEDLVIVKTNVRMKYKSTPHLVIKSPISFTDTGSFSLPVVDIRRQSVNNPFGGDSIDALKANIWLPCGKPVLLGNKTDDETGETITKFNYNYGDTYFQRWDCLKTYPFTREDVNQIVEIGSFVLESHINCDGRYDRNRGQQSNINMSPTNFNLINPVYNQRDNFFSYRIQDDDFYTNVKYPNQVTWTKEKNAGADVDLWTNITMASTYDMDGSKGKVEELVTYKDQIYCFQPKGVSNILFNSRVQIPASDGVPIEISNSYKVDGYRYLSDGIGCDDKQLVKKTPAGIYFIDSIGSHLFHLNEQGISDLAEQCNMTTWFRDNAGTINRLVYDDINHDVYAVQDSQALCFSEKLNQFTGFYNYGSIDLIETYDHHVFNMYDRKLWKMFEGQYCNLFDNNVPWGFTFISNGLNDGAVNLDKTFTNLEFRAGVEGDGELDQETGKFTPTLPLDTLETWNEYQHGITALKNLTGHAAMQHPNEGDSALKRKFRIWRCDIPRNNAPLDTDAGLPRLSRKVRKPVDRMRNPWLYLKLQKSAADDGKVLPKTEIHDINLSYFV